MNLGVAGPDAIKRRRNKGAAVSHDCESKQNWAKVTQNRVKVTHERAIGMPVVSAVDDMGVVVGVRIDDAGGGVEPALPRAVLFLEEAKVPFAKQRGVCVEIECE